MFTIKEIYKVPYMSGRSGNFAYVGTLRNAKRFNIGDIVFVSLFDGKIVKTSIVGVELPPTNNPDYIYKVRISEEWVRQYCPRDINFYEANNFTYELICDRIFNSIEDAKQSAIDNAVRMHTLEMEEIKQYFKQFEAFTK